MIILKIFLRTEGEILYNMVDVHSIHIQRELLKKKKM